MDFDLDMETACASTSGGVKQAYAAPALTLYGSVCTLTATGSGPSREQANPDGTCANGPHSAHC